MTPVEPTVHAGATLVVFAQDQPQYVPLPASVDPEGLVMTEWEPTAEELDRLLCGGRIRLWVHTFGEPLQPISLEAIKPACGMRDGLCYKVNMHEHLRLLGFPVRDAVTGFEGVVESIAFDLYGCVQAVVKGGLDEKGLPQDGRWFDTKRLTAVSATPVMTVPTFEVIPGGAEKPAQPQMPGR